MFGFGTLQSALATSAIIVIGAGALLVGVYSHGYDVASAKLQPKIDILTGIVATDDMTIKLMTADAAVNDALLAEYTDAVNLLTKKAFDDQNALRRLEQNDQTVSAYLHTPVPDALRSLLNDEPAATPSGKDRLPPTPQGPRATMPVATRRED